MTGVPEMLRAANDFAALQHSTRSRSERLLVVRLATNDKERTRFGIATGRRIGGAVVRNKVRRRIRESLRALAPRINIGWDVLIVARPESATASMAELAGTLERLLRKAGALRAEGTEV
ncbi:MAG: ribonuclease P protein component [Candidatus Limnocylindrales bacterium]